MNSFKILNRGTKKNFNCYAVIYTSLRKKWADCYQSLTIDL